MSLLDQILAYLGVATEAVLLAVPTVIALVAWLKARGLTFPDVTLFGREIDGNTLLTLLVSLIVGGYAQYVVSPVWYAVLAAGVLAYLAAAGVYDTLRAVFVKREEYAIYEAGEQGEM